MAFPVSETKVREARLTGTAKSMWIVCRYLSTDRLTSVAASMCSLAVPLPSFGSIPLQLRAVTPIGSSQYLSCLLLSAGSDQLFCMEKKKSSTGLRQLEAPPVKPPMIRLSLSKRGEPDEPPAVHPVAQRATFQCEFSLKSVTCIL